MKTQKRDDLYHRLLYVLKNERGAVGEEEEDDEEGEEEEEESEEKEQDRQKDDRFARIPRGQLRRLEKKAQKADQLEPENTTLKQELALMRAGLGELTDKQRKALLAAHDGDLTSEALKATAVELRMAEEAPPEEPSEEEQELDEMDKASKAAASGSAPSGRITPDDAAKWDEKKARRFMQKHPEEYELLMAGQPVFGITDFN